MAWNDVLASLGMVKLEKAGNAVAFAAVSMLGDKTDAVKADVRVLKKEQQEVLAEIVAAEADLKVQIQESEAAINKFNTFRATVIKAKDIFDAKPEAEKAANQTALQELIGKLESLKASMDKEADDVVKAQAVLNKLNDTAAKYQKMINELNDTSKEIIEANKDADRELKLAERMESMNSPTGPSAVTRMALDAVKQETAKKQARLRQMDLEKKFSSVEDTINSNSLLQEAQASAIAAGPTLDDRMKNLGV